MKAHTVFFDTDEEKEIFQRWLYHIHYKTGLKYGEIVNRAMMAYNMVIEGKKAE